MDMEIDDSPEGEKTEPTVVMLVGAPGSGKSTFCDTVMRSSRRPWVRVCQDTINNGKAGTKAQCLKMAINALKESNSIFIDRCNLDRDQRSEFVKLGGAEVEVHAVVLDLPAQVCISRSVKRTGHEGNLQGGRAAAVVNRMLQSKELPKLSEGFSRITFCYSDKDVENAVSSYSLLGPKDTLPSGCFGQKNTNAKSQLGIMKFFKKVNALPGPASKEASTSQESNEKTAKKEENLSLIPSAQLTSTDIIPTLAFPSISTADFQFDLEKAADIIVEKVEEFLPMLGNARVVLVDLSHGSKILSLVKTKASQKNIDSARFFTFVGDITKLRSEGGLQCSAIANAANWRLKPGGGGVNASIFMAAGSDLEAATRQRANSLLPGKAVVVALPSTCPLVCAEGITHVIHVLGPNMNPKRPNYLNNDYTNGCKILREAYTSLFEGFLSIIKNQSKLPKRRNETTRSGSGGEEIKEDPERNKKCKGLQDVVIADESNTGAVGHVRDGGKSKSKGWGSWALALYNIAMQPDRHENIVLEVLDDIVVINDQYPKARKHLLIIARQEGLDRFADAQREHLQLLQKMHDVGSKWVKRFWDDDPSLVFRLGYHSVPSMRQLHLHVISQDFDSDHLKNKKHWNSFTSSFFRDSVDVMEEINVQGMATVASEDVLTAELRCHRCKSAHPSIPKLKSHIRSCRAPFPDHFLQNNRLLTHPDSETD
ncbi:PREDICTED: transcription factor bHLH140 [Tarenaya hassleriana]|uniref:transcription factor bHLH140 n=1 Tax=Tarenaya hassleriana TaxID=28532 RepID=UPI0008FD40A9|nr:PREDICTED: transcription factor bHLH140 [Tarenaya hassleriana]